MFYFNFIVKICTYTNIFFGVQIHLHNNLYSTSSNKLRFGNFGLTLDLTICHLVTISGNVLSCFSSAIFPLYSRSLIQIYLLRSICQKKLCSCWFQMEPMGTKGLNCVLSHSLNAIAQFIWNKMEYYNLIFAVFHLWRLAITTLDKQSCFLL